MYKKQRIYGDMAHLVRNFHGDHLGDTHLHLSKVRASVESVSDIVLYTKVAQG